MPEVTGLAMSRAVATVVRHIRETMRSSLGTCET